MSYSDDLINEGTILFEQGKISEAWQTFREALAYDKNNGAAYFGCAVCCMRSGNVNKSREYLDLAIKAGNESARICLSEMVRLEDGRAEIRSRETIVNKTRKIFEYITDKNIFIYTFGAIVLAVLFPPWKYVIKTQSVEIENTAGYSFLLFPPTPKGYQSVMIDFKGLVFNWLVIILCSLFLLYVFKYLDKRK